MKWKLGLVLWLFMGTSVYAQNTTTLRSPFESAYTFTGNGNGPCWIVPDGTAYYSLRIKTLGTVSAGTVTLRGSKNNDCSSLADVIAAQDVTSVTTVNGTNGVVGSVQLVFAAYSGTGSIRVTVLGDKSSSAIGASVTVTSGNITADTELPAAAAAADGAANPTIPAVLAYPMAFNGTTWDRATKVSDDCDGTQVSRDRFITTGTSDNEHQVKGTAGTFCWIQARNAHATTAAFIKCTNLTAANTTPGSSAIFWDTMIPAASASIPMQVHLPFDTALTCYAVTGKTDADATDVAADDVTWVIGYR